MLLFIYIKIFCSIYLLTQGISQVLYLIIFEQVIIKFLYVIHIDFFFFNFKVVPSQQAYTETNPHQDVWKLLPSGNFPPKSRGAAFVSRRRWMFSCPRQWDTAGGICLMFVVSTKHVLSSQVTHSHVIRHTIYVL